MVSTAWRHFYNLIGNLYRVDTWCTKHRKVAHQRQVVTRSNNLTSFKLHFNSSVHLLVTTNNSKSNLHLKWISGLLTFWKSSKFEFKSLILQNLHSLLNTPFISSRANWQRMASIFCSWPIHSIQCYYCFVRTGCNISSKAWIILKITPNSRIWWALIATSY